MMRLEVSGTAILNISGMELFNIASVMMVGLIMANAKENIVIIVREPRSRRHSSKHLRI